MLINPATKKAIDNYLSKPSHALILTGSLGTGKTYVGRYIAAQLLDQDAIDNYPYFLETEADKQSIETVRQIKTYLAKKTTGTNHIRRIVLLNSADNLSDAAQNALLKSIEEPPADTVIILTVSDITRLLPTIQSRCVSISILPISEKDALKYFADNYETAVVRRACLLSKGNAGLLHGLLSHPDHELHAAVLLAKEILQANTFEKIAKIEEVVKGKIPISEMIEAIEIAIKINFINAIDAGNTSAQFRFHTILRHIALCREQLAAKTNPKLVLTRLFLEM